jgi:hypothetical protein
VDPVILAPYDHGSPHYLLRDGKLAVISETAARALMGYGIGLSSDYTGLEDGKPYVLRVNYPSSVVLDLEGARKAADEGSYRLSKKARSLL